MPKSKHSAATPVSAPARGRALPRPAKKRPLAIPEPAPVSEREPRGARRKRETRTRLLDAAFRLMAERGMADVAINEITEAADVGAGSFYNHFESKESIYHTLIEAVFDEFGDALGRLATDLTDPAEVISVCVRHTIRRAGREPIWGQFLIREGLSGRALARGLGQRLWRDIQTGVSSGRLQLADPVMSFIAAGGGVLAAIAMQIELQNVSGPSAMLAKQMGLSAGDVGERAAAVLLQTLGLSREQSEKIARRPLPEVADAHFGG